MMLHESRPSRRATSAERRFLEQIIVLRDAYAGRGPMDSESMVSLSSAIAAAELEMHSLRDRDNDLRHRLAGG